jgi:hypothetical protein
MEARTENPPSAEGDPEPSEARAITSIYALLGDRVPTIIYVPAWATWVCQGDIPTSQFASLDAYLEEFPFQVMVSPTCVVVTDPGFGKGAMEWVVRVLDSAGGAQLVALTETDAHTENPDCKIWIGQYRDDDWEDLTEIVLPPVARSSFFGAAPDPAILEDYELVTLQYALDRESMALSIVPLPNVALACVDGRVRVEDLDPADEARICAAWAHFKPTQINCTFDPRAGRYLLDGIAAK